MNFPNADSEPAPGNPKPRPQRALLRTGWRPALAQAVLIMLLFEAVSGFGITLLRFGVGIQWATILHTLVGVVMLLPLAWYSARHWLDYRGHALSQTVLLGHVAWLGLAVCSISGAWVTWQALFLIKTSLFWRKVHLLSTFVALGGLLPHVAVVFIKAWKGDDRSLARRCMLQTAAGTALGLTLTTLMPLMYSGREYVNEFPKDYNYLYGTNRPFAPSLARTDTGGAFDARSLSGSL